MSNAANADFAGFSPEYLTGCILRAYKRASNADKASLRTLYKKITGTWPEEDEDVSDYSDTKPYPLVLANGKKIPPRIFESWSDFAYIMGRRLDNQYLLEILLRWYERSGGEWLEPPSFTGLIKNAQEASAGLQNNQNTSVHEPVSPDEENNLPPPIPFRLRPKSTAPAPNNRQGTRFSLIKNEENHD
ncbi:MAG TPA: hypothetical protein VH186_15610 [Chloroflexia bacterium]|nr:hypothetical protein [Chloroflexia bacterium]